ncbi:MAG: methionyl-tRNA formyltransferase [Trueperaceae bacterium]|nr:methionyl-tRNA formyltransferase [Trueperaceae bacterium]
MKPLRVAFFGSPEFALPTFEALSRQHDVVVVVSQPDRPAGRGLGLRRPAVAAAAVAAGLPLLQPRKVKRNEELLAHLAALDLDVGVTAAYGRILPPELLALPRFGVLNVHASLLPRWRGAAPIQWALIAGDRVTGITVMQTDAGLDTGAIRLQRRTPVETDEDAPALSARLAALGAEVLAEALTLLSAGSLPLVAQDPDAATLAPPLTPRDGEVRWADTAGQVHDRHRGVAGWPGTSFVHAGQRVKVGTLLLASDERGGGAPGTVLGFAGENLLVACGAGLVEIGDLKPESKGMMSARAWANGRSVKAGAQLV